MKLGRWVHIGSLILLMCAHQGDSTLILGSMLMAATAAMTGGLIMGPLTVGGLIMLMMMAANNNQNAQQRQQTSATSNIASTLENSQNLLNLLATLTGAAGNLATSASTQQASVFGPTNAPKAAKRALYDPNNFPQNLDELLAASSRQTATRRQWKSIPQTTTSSTTTTTTRAPTARANNDFWNAKPTNYFSPDTGFAVEPIPDDLLDIAMRLPQAKNANMFGDLFDDGTVSTGSSTGSGSSSAGTTAPEFDGMFSPPRPIVSAEQQLRWVASEPGDLFSSFPEIKEEDILNLVRKRATREALSSKFRLEDIANVTYANDKDPIVKEQLNEREKQDEINTRIFRQLSALDPFRCLPQLACNMQATPPSQQSGILNDYAYLLKTVFERDEDDEEDDQKTGSSSVTKNANGGSTAGSVASEILSVLTSQSKRKKKLDYKSPTKSGSQSASKTKKGGKGKKSDDDDASKQDDKNDDDDDDDDDDDGNGFSSEEIPMDEDELDRLLLKEQYELEQEANEELLNDDPDLLPYVLKSASKAPPYLGPDIRDPNAAAAAGATGAVQSELGSGPSHLPSGPSGIGGRVPLGRHGAEVGRGPAPAVTYGQPPPLFSASKLAKYRTEELDNMSSKELNNLLRQVSYPGEIIQVDDGTFGDNRGSISEILGSWVPHLPQVAVGFQRRRTHTGNAAFDDDPFFDDFDFRRRSMNFNQANVQQQQPKLRKVRRVVRKVRESGPAGRVAYLRRMKRVLDSERDPAMVFKMATEIGAKVKSSRQCRFLFNGCPLNSTQLLGMIGNIRKAVVGLSNAQQLLTGNVNLAALTKQTQQQQTSKDFEQNLATIGPNVVTFATTAPQTSTTTTVPPPPAVHQLTPMAPLQMVQPMLGSPQPPPPPPPQTSQSSQNTIVVPQIVQVPMPIHSPPPQQQQPIFIQQQPQMQQMQHMGNMASLHSHPVFNVISDSNAQSSGLTSISHELPSGEMLQFNMKITGQQNGIPVSATIPSRPKPSIPLSSSRPSQQSPIHVNVRPVGQSSSRPLQLQSQSMQNIKVRNPAADLVDLFDDDNAENYLLPSKTLIETEIKEPNAGLDSLQAAILAIEKINQAASDKKNSKPAYLEDDERELDTKLESHLVASLKKSKVPTTRPATSIKTTTTKNIVPAGLRQPNDKSKNKEQADEESDDDETSEEDDEDEDEEDFRYRTRLPDPLDPKRRDFIPIPTKETQFQEASQLTIPATQTFVKKQLQLEDSAASSSEEDEQQQQHSQRRMLAATTRRKVRRPRILYPQDDIEKPVFIPL